MVNNYYIYIYLDPRKSGRYCYNDLCFLYKPFYVGKGKSYRWKEIKWNRNSHFINIINEIKKSELEPIVIKLYDNLNEEQAFKLETKSINKIGRIKLKTGTLINKTSGGQGTSGYKHTEKTKEKLRKNFQEIKKEFEKRKCKLLTEENEYKDCKTKLKYICSEGHECFIRWNDFQQEHGCPYCAKNKINYQEIKQEFERRRYILLTEEKDYKNSKDTKLEYICSEEHKGSIIWGNFQQGQGCKICDNKLRSEKMKENNSNHKLTEKQVIQIKLLLKEGILTQQEIADMFGVSRTIISAIKTGRCWTHIKV